MPKRTKPSLYADIYEEGTEEYENTHVDPGALSRISDIVKRLKQGKGFIGEQCAWFDNACPSYEIPLVYNPSQAIIDKQAIKKAIETRDMLLPTVNALSKIFGLVSHQLRTCEEDIESFENRAGFFILPDEILSTVLEYAALMEHQDEDRYSNRKKCLNKEDITAITVKAATRLSHVCKRFRDLITHSSGLWNRVYNTMSNSGMVSSCLSKCRRANAEVTLRTPLFEPLNPIVHKRIRKNGSFIHTVLEHSQKCMTFTLDGNEEHTPSRAEPRDGFLQDYSDLAKDIDFHNLASLDVRYPQTALSSRVRGSKSFHDAMHFYRSWSTPRLQSLATRNFVPIRFSGTRSLTLLDLSLDFDSYKLYRKDDVWDASSLVLFLEQSPDLEKFKFTLIRANKSTIPSVSKPAVVMPRLSDLDFRFVQCRDESLKTFFNLVCFKNVMDMRLYVSSLNERDKQRGALIEDIFSAIFPNADAFPVLMDLSLNVRVNSFYDEELDDFVYGNFAIPFAAIPHLKHLDLTANSVEVLPVPNGNNTLPAIRTLTIRDSDKIQKGWLVEFVKQMEKQRCLDLFRLSVDNQCYALNSSGVKGALSKDDMLRLIANEDSESISAY